MRERPIGITALAFSSILVALYGQYAAIALLMTGSVFTAAGSIHGAVTLITGAVFLGLTVAAYFVGYGFWTRKHWAWAGGLVVFAVLMGASIFLSIISSSFVSALLPSAGASVATVYLQRPAVRAELLGTEPKPGATRPVPGRVDAPKPAH